MDEPTPRDGVPETALGWHRAGRGAAIATVVETWGSAPRRAGSLMAVSGEMELAGSVSGGCVEGAVAEEALDAIATGRPRMLEYGVSDGDAFAVGLACGGTIRVLLESVAAMGEARLAELVRLRAAHVPAVYTVDVERWERAVHAGPGLPPDLAERAAADRTGADGARVSVVHNPPLRMAIVGGVHIAQALAGMAALAGFDVTVIDPRAAFASAARFPGTAIDTAWPDAAMGAFAPDGRSAVVTLTHDPKLDDPALHVALRSEAFYVGALGSRRTNASRAERLRAAGFGEEALARVHGPVGLDIGAATPGEIAAAILAEAIACLRGRGAAAGRAAT